MNEDYQNLKQTFAQRLKTAMKSRNIAASELAEKIGVDKSAIRHYVSPSINAMPKSDKLVRIAEELDVSIDYLLGLSEDEKIEESALDDYETFFRKKLIRLKEHCDLGMDHFCDGSVNKSMAKIGTAHVSACKYYKNGLCKNPKINEDGD